MSPKTEDPSSMVHEAPGANVPLDARCGLAADKEQGVVVDSDDQSLPEIDKDAERKVVRKFDYTVMCITFLIFFAKGIGRRSLGHAKTDGLEKDLHFHGNQYSMLIMAVNIPLCLLCLPANLITRRYQPKWFIVGFTMGAGILAMCYAAAKNFNQMIVTRVLLGTIDAGFRPCCMFYLSTFYTRGELASRYAIWYSGGAFAGGLSGLLAFGLFQAGGALKGWQYLFLLQGGFTFSMGVLAAFVLPETPWGWKRLNEEEKELTVNRGKRDSTSKVNTAWDVKEGLKPFKTLRIYVLSVIALCYGVGSSAVGSFLPQIITTLGYSKLKTNWLTVFPNIFGAIFLYAFARSSDRRRERSAHLLVSMLICLIGLIIMLSLNPKQHPGVAYFATFLMCGGGMTPTALFHSWHVCNLPTENGRIYVLSYMIGAANSGGFITSMTYRKQDEPRHVPFLLATAVCTAVGMLLIIAVRWWMVRDNNRRDRILGKKLRSKDVPLSELVNGSSDLRWRWFV
ncbi:major facilitator superfamily domain-containing protein [Phyllosticta capitalensis]